MVITTSEDESNDQRSTVRSEVVCVVKVLTRSLHVVNLNPQCLYVLIGMFPCHPKVSVQLLKRG